MKIDDVRKIMEDIDTEFAKYMIETGNTSVSGLYSKIIGRAIKRFPRLNEDK